MSDRPEAAAAFAADLYLDLLKRALTRRLFPRSYASYAPPRGSVVGVGYRAASAALRRVGLEIVRRTDTADREAGRDWPADAETMVGMARLDNLQSCVETVIRDRVPGDLIETGVWRGGSIILMRAVLAAYGEPGRIVWAADSFAGLPPPDVGRNPADSGDRLFTFPDLAVPLEEVRANIARYRLLDERVRFIKGWFADTLPTAPIERLAVLRLDGDMYGSTMDALVPLYPKLSVGGFVIVDDYGIESCRQAVHDFRERNGIEDPIQRIDDTGVYWRRTR